MNWFISQKFEVKLLIIYSLWILIVAGVFGNSDHAMELLVTGLLSISAYFGFENYRLKQEVKEQRKRNKNKF